MAGGDIRSMAGVRDQRGRGGAVAAALLMCCVSVACSDAVVASTSSYSAALSGLREVPANQSRSTGSAAVEVSRTELRYVVTASGFDTPLVVAHMQIGAPGTVGFVLIPLDVKAQSGTVASGTMDISGYLTFNTVTISGDSLRTLLARGFVYVNLRTAGYPDGEIRGQLGLAP